VLESRKHIIINSVPRSLKFVTVILTPDSWFLLDQIFKKGSHLVVKSTCGAPGKIQAF